MALDILISDNHDKTIKSIPLFLKNYDPIMEQIESRNNFFILNRILSDYYGEGEVYLDELNSLKSEVMELKLLFRISDPNKTKIFLNDFLELIETAIKQNKTIKLIGD